ncbi:MAG: tetratricopeptide repeat protein [Ignavibacteriae bacterium]|jgi:outer membrane assembly lipoprotein YfiO|nr:outer membrane protein assembly factor BamD [Ignavibacteriota bacterium]NOH00168.1 tetratricopeptide repeat protein [Ignavibacteriota bacterium]
MKKIFLSANIIFLILLTACGTKTESELFDEAQKNIDEKNYTEALTNFEMIVEKYPNGKYTEGAILEIGKLYHGKVVKNITESESMKKAVEYYKQVFEKYPEHKDAKQAMFMAGFILANDIKDYDQAREIYNKFIEKYPDSELAFSAKSELENLGKDPEEILQSKSAKAQ